MTKFSANQPRCQPPRHAKQSEPEPAAQVKPVPRASANENRTHTLNGCVSMSVSTSQMSLPRKPSSQAVTGELIDSGRSTKILYHLVLPNAETLLLIEATGFLLCHVVLPKTNSDHIIDSTFTGVSKAPRLAQNLGVLDLARMVEHCDLKQYRSTITRQLRR